MTHPDFSTRPLIAGSILGVRTFQIDTLGRLRGVSYDTVFTPSENIAQCRAGYKHTDEEGNEVAGTLNCECGYYAYFNGDNDYKDNGSHQITAIIEGYGTVTVGSRGFRAGKAKVVALIDNPRTHKVGFIHRQWDKFADWTYNTRIPDGLFFAMWLLSCLAAVGFLIAGIATTIDLPTPWLGLSFLTAFPFVAFFAIGVMPANAHASRRRGKTTNSYGQSRKCEPSPCSGTKDERRHRRDLVRRAYPEVPVFATLSEALKQFPLHEPEIALPEIDESFWTRHAKI